MFNFLLLLQNLFNCLASLHSIYSCMHATVIICTRRAHSKYLYSIVYCTSYLLICIHGDHTVMCIFLLGKASPIYIHRYASPAWFRIGRVGNEAPTNIRIRHTMSPILSLPLPFPPDFNSHLFAIQNDVFDVPTNYDGYLTMERWLKSFKTHSSHASYAYSDSSWYSGCEQFLFFYIYIHIFFNYNGLFHEN